jgi:hypothetical protein
MQRANSPISILMRKMRMKMLMGRMIRMLFLAGTLVRTLQLGEVCALVAT